MVKRIFLFLWAFFCCTVLTVNASVQPGSLFAVAPSLHQEYQFCCQILGNWPEVKKQFQSAVAWAFERKQLTEQDRAGYVNFLAELKKNPKISSIYKDIVISFLAESEKKRLGSWPKPLIAAAVIAALAATGAWYWWPREASQVPILAVASKSESPPKPSLVQNNPFYDSIERALTALSRSGYNHSIEPVVQRLRNSEFHSFSGNVHVFSDAVSGKKQYLVLGTRKSRVGAGVQADGGALNPVSMQEVLFFDEDFKKIEANVLDIIKQDLYQGSLRL